MPCQSRGPHLGYQRPWCLVFHRSVGQGVLVEGFILISSLSRPRCNACFCNAKTAPALPLSVSLSVCLSLSPSAISLSLSLSLSLSAISLAISLLSLSLYSVSVSVSLSPSSLSLSTVGRYIKNLPSFLHSSSWPLNASPSAK